MLFSPVILEAFAFFCNFGRRERISICDEWRAQLRTALPACRPARDVGFELEIDNRIGKLVSDLDWHLHS